MDVGLMEGYIFGLPLISVMPFLIIFFFGVYGRQGNGIISWRGTER